MNARAGKTPCAHCAGRNYLVCLRDDGFFAIERCDACSVGVLTDEQAAALAREDGIVCERHYPCRLLSTRAALLDLEITWGTSE